MNTEYKIVTQIRCSICNKGENIITTLLAPREDVAIEWATKHVEQSKEFAAFERKHSKHKNIDKYKEVGLL